MNTTTRGMNETFESAALPPSATRDHSRGEEIDMAGGAMAIGLVAAVGGALTLLLSNANIPDVIQIVSALAL